tara:strand:+ start:2566 stop:5619 length:3054 start_codon:yes stop_codon:yes gene_type:complete
MLAHHVQDGHLLKQTKQESLDLLTLPLLSDSPNKKRTSSLRLIACLYITLLTLMMFAQPVAAQDILGTLTGGNSNKSSFHISTPSQRIVKSLNQRLKVVDKQLEEAHKQEAQLDKRIQRDRKHLEQLSKKLKHTSLRHLFQLFYTRKQQYLLGMGRLQVAMLSHIQNIKILHAQIKQRASMRTKTDTWLQEKYKSAKDPKALDLDVQTLQSAIKKETEERNILSKSIKQFETSLERSRETLDKTKRKLLKLAPVDPESPKPSTLPSTKPSVKQRNELQRVKQKWIQLYWQEEILRLTYLYHQLQFDWFTLRKKDQQVEFNTLDHRIKMRTFILNEIKRQRKTLLSHTREGLLFFRPHLFAPEQWKQFRTHFEKTLKTSTPHFQVLRIQVRDHLKKTKGGVVLQWVLFSLFLLLVVYFVVSFIRRRLKAAIIRLAERKEAGNVTHRFWHAMLLALRSLRKVTPYVGGILLLWVALYYVPLPVVWEDLFLLLCISLVAFVLYSALIGQLFSPIEAERYLQNIDKEGARRFRIVFLVIGALSALYFWGTQWLSQLGFPNFSLRYLNLIFYGIVVIGCLLLLLNKDTMLTLIPSDTQLGRTVIVFVYRVYNWIFLFILGLYGLYVWGYVNLASYIARGLVLSLILISTIVALARLAWTLNLWTFGFVKGEGGLIQVEKKWARNLLRMTQASMVALLSLFGFSVLLEIWGIANGFWTLFQLPLIPFVQVQDTQINLLSLLKFVLSVGVAFFLSHFIRKRLTSLVYPALRLSASNQHAANTIIVYLIITVGILVGLQWMGVGIGVLAVFAGIVGIGIGFGLQNIMSNFISGLIITFGQPFKVGDLIEVGGIMGEVLEISIRSTTVETYDYRIVLVPNSEILTTKLINWSMGKPYVCVPMEVGVAYGSDVALVKKLLLEIADAHPDVLKTPSPDVRFQEFGSDSLLFRVWVNVNDPMARFKVISELRFKTDEVFAKHDVVIAFPQRDIHLNPALEEAAVRSLQAWSTRPEPAQTTEPKTKGDPS